ncbi:MAG: proline--tRNA ligase [Nitrososphaerales archaeon]
MSKEIGITVKKSEDFSEWYTQVVIKAELADYSLIKGFIVLRPYGYAIWENIKNIFDRMIKKLGHQNAYFPLFIPESLLKKEEEHFKGFTPEVFWVTHTGDTPLNERLAVRPTSETIAYASYAKWIKSWRDLPLLLNFWNSVLRAEIKSTKPFIRTSEFLWQEGHTVHETKEDADKEVMRILELYRRLIEDYLLIPVLKGFKSDKEKFVGALYTTTLEAVMPDGKVLQMGTSHNLGQNFSKPFDIKFIGRDGKQYYAWQTSWGISWRLIGAMIMTHGDDKGLIIPPKVAPLHIVIIPIFYNEEEKKKVEMKGKEVFNRLHKAKLRVIFDNREEYTPGWKFNEWELKGVPIRVEIGPRDLREGKVTLVRRDTSERVSVEEKFMVQEVRKLLKKIEKNLFAKAKAHLNNSIHIVKDYEEFKRLLDSKGGLLKACWCQKPVCEKKIKEETGADIRLIPLKKEKVFSNCIYCGDKASVVAYFGKAY